jgi:sarcosine oxidase
MNERRDVVVIGGGLLGLAAARAMAGRGRDVLLLEQAAIGHQAGGSKGSCRIFRLGYDDLRYVIHARRARALWDELEYAAGERLLYPAPQLTFGEQMPQVMDALWRAGERYELLSAAQAAERFPGVSAEGQVLYEPESAVIAADRVLAVLAAAVPDTRCGVRVTELADDGRRVRVSTDAGVLDAGVVIVCAGPWTAELLATAGLTLPAAATQEQIAYLVPAGAPPAGQIPIFVSFGSEIPYGLPVPNSPRYKIGVHHAGPTVDPRRLGQSADDELSRTIERLSRRYLPDFDPHPVAVERCVYDDSPDTHFVVGRIGNVVIGSGTSGHGFKFGPLFGEWLASLALGNGAAGSGDALDVPPEFAPGRLGLARARPAGPG